MKFNYLLSSILVFYLLICISCVKESISEPTMVTDCFQFKDSRTNVPIEGVSVTLQCYDPYIRSNFGRYFTTDAKGMVCWDHKSGVLIESWFAKGKALLYEDICNNVKKHGDNIIYYPIPDIVLMKKTAYYKFIIKNIEPKSANDEIKVKSLDLTCFGTLDISLVGSAIDTTIIRETKSGNSYVSWESTGANVQTEYLETFTQSRDTITVEIEY